MKTIMLYAAGLMILFSSCQKSNTTPQSKILKAYNSGALFNTWVINDENDAQQTSTKNSEMFIAKFSPHILIKKDKSYTFSYTTVSSKTVTETGTWSYDNVDMLTLKGDAFVDNSDPKNPGKMVSYDYTFQITKLSEEDLILDRIFNRTINSKEGTVTQDAASTKETLYMEDND